MGVRWRRRKAERFDEVLARCLALLDEGASVQSCLAAHPAHTVQLEPALQTALALRARLAAAEPDPAFARRARERMLAAAARHQAPAAPPELPRHGWLQLPSIRPLATAGAALTLVAVAAVPVAATTSADALPGDWNYTIKRGTERVLLALSFTDHLALADERAEEVRELAERGKFAEVVTATRAYEAELRQARREVDPNAVTAAEAQKVEQRVSQQQAQIAAAGEAVQEQQAQIAAAQPGSPPPPAVVEARQATQSALNSATETRQDIQQVAVAAQARATASPAASPSPARTPAPTTVIVTAPASPAAGGASPGPATPVPTVTVAPSVTPTTTVIAASATPEPSATATPPSTATRPPEPSATPEPAVTATRPPQPSATASPVPTQPATRPPQPSATASPVPTQPATATRPPQPSATASPVVAPNARVAMLDLAAGQHTLVYHGPTAPVDQAFAALGGKLGWIEWTPPGSRVTIRYAPGEGSRFVILSGSSVTIFLTDGVLIPMGTLTLP